MVDFIEAHRGEYGAEPICRILPIAPATYYLHRRRRAHPELRAARSLRDEELKAEILRVYDENYLVYGARKVWVKLNKEGIATARSTVERLMAHLGLSGVTRGRAFKVVTTTSDDSARPLDLVERRFEATRPNQLWVADITYVATWSGMAYVAFVVDVFSRAIVGWRVSSSLKTDIALDALEQAIWARQPSDKLVHHSDHGVQYLSIRYTERLLEEGICCSPRFDWTPSERTVRCQKRSPSKRLSLVGDGDSPSSKNEHFSKRLSFPVLPFPPLRVSMGSMPACCFNGDAPWKTEKKKVWSLVRKSYLRAS